MSSEIGKREIGLGFALVAALTAGFALVGNWTWFVAFGGGTVAVVALMVLIFSVRARSIGHGISEGLRWTFGLVGWLVGFWTP